MFERSIIDMSNQWYDVSLGDIAELLVFYDKVRIKTPGGRLTSLLSEMLWLEDGFRTLTLFHDLVVDERINLIIDNFPPGEIALQANVVLPLLSQSSITNDSVIPYSLGLESDDKKPKVKNEFVRVAMIQMWANHEEAMKDASGIVERILSLVKGEAIDSYTEERMVRLINTMNMVNEEEKIGPEFYQFLRNYFIGFEKYTEKKFQELISKISVKTVDIHGYECRAIAYDSIGAGDLMPALNHLQCMVDYGGNRNTDCDLYQSDRTASILASQYERTIRLGTNIEECRVFQETIVPGQSIANQINNGQKSFTEIESLIANREQFAKVVRNKPSDVGLAEWYFGEVSKSFLSDNFEQRALRWGTFTIPGLIVDTLTTGSWGTATGLTFSALDSLFFNQIKSNRGANVFVNNRLKPFLDS